MPWRLSSTDYQNLVEVAHSSHDPRQMHRAQALRWLHEGDTVDEVATRLFVTPRTVCRWRCRFDERQRLPLPARLTAGPRRGRPTTVHGSIDPLISEVLDGAPRPCGYHATVWTAPLLRQYLRDVHHIQASRRSVGLALARLGMAWTRPRYALARRAATWRQAKGGSNEAVQAAGVRGYGCGMRQALRTPHPCRGATVVLGSRYASPLLASEPGACSTAPSIYGQARSRCGSQIVGIKTPIHTS